MSPRVISATGNQSSLTPYDWGAQPSPDKPAVTITTPANGASYGRGQNVAAAYSCTASPGATLSSCTGTVPTGRPIDTQSVGTHTFTVTASDNLGATNSQTVTYNVTAMAAPHLSHLRQSAKIWRADNKLPQISAKSRRPPVGTTFSFTLNVPARVGFSFSQKMSGRNVKGRCVSQTNKNNRKPHCTRTVSSGSFTFNARSGNRTVRFAGRVSRTKKLHARPLHRHRYRDRCQPPAIGTIDADLHHRQVDQETGPGATRVQTPQPRILLIRNPRRRRRRAGRVRRPGRRE